MGHSRAASAAPGAPPACWDGLLGPQARQPLRLSGAESATTGSAATGTMEQLMRNGNFENKRMKQLLLCGRHNSSDALRETEAGSPGRCTQEDASAHEQGPGLGGRRLPWPDSPERACASRRRLRPPGPPPWARQPVLPGACPGQRLPGGWGHTKPSTK